MRFGKQICRIKLRFFGGHDRNFRWARGSRFNFWLKFRVPRWIGNERKTPDAFQFVLILRSNIDRFANYSFIVGLKINLLKKKVSKGLIEIKLRVHRSLHIYTKEQIFHSSIKFVIQRMIYVPTYRTKFNNKNQIKRT